MTDDHRLNGRIGPPPSHIIETEIKGDISVFDAERNEVLVLNATASDVWRLCDGEQTLDDIIGLLASAYDTDPAAIRGDVVSTVDQFIQQGFLSEP